MEKKLTAEDFVSSPAKKQGCCEGCDLGANEACLSNNDNTLVSDLYSQLYDKYGGCYPNSIIFKLKQKEE